MKSISKILSISVLVATLAIFSCKSDSEDPTPGTPKTQTELLTLSPWVLSAVTNVDAVDFDGDGQSSKDIYAQMLPCERDDSYQFNKDSTTTELAVTKCAPSEPAIFKGDWMFTKDKKNIDWDGEIYAISELTETRMVLVNSFTVGTDNYTLTSTYIHK